MRRYLASLALVLTAAPGLPASAQQAADVSRRPIVVELFTSQSCSSCPPADALLSEMARTRTDLLPLAFHVTYWNGLGWRDPFSLPAATERQRAYAARLGGPVYTPELVVEGAAGVLGSDRDQAEGAIRRSATALTTAASMQLSRHGDRLSVEIGPGAGRGTLLLVGFDPSHSTAVGAGENGGRRLLEANIVRSIQPIAEWTGQRLHIEQKTPSGEQFALLLQAPDGRIIGAARTL